LPRARSGTAPSSARNNRVRRLSSSEALIFAQRV
jgi:hypothetical protein